MELIISLVINCLLLGFILKDKLIKQKHPQWVVDFYKDLHYAIKTNSEFRMDVSAINDQEWIAMYKGLRDGHKMPLGLIDFIGNEMIVKPQVYTGSRVKKFKIIMDYTPNIKPHSLQEHSPGPIDYKISYSKVLKD